MVWVLFWYQIENFAICIFSILYQMIKFLFLFCRDAVETWSRQNKIKLEPEIQYKMGQCHDAQSPPAQSRYAQCRPRCSMQALLRYTCFAIHGSPRGKSYATFSLHSYIPLQAGAKFGRTRKISVEVVYLLVQ